MRRKVIIYIRTRARTSHSCWGQTSRADASLWRRARLSALTCMTLPHRRIHHRPIRLLHVYLSILHAAASLDSSFVLGICLRLVMLLSPPARAFNTWLYIAMNPFGARVLLELQLSFFLRAGSFCLFFFFFLNSIRPSLRPLVRSFSDNVNTLIPRLRHPKELETQEERKSGGAFFILWPILALLLDAIFRRK